MRQAEKKQGHERYVEVYDIKRTLEMWYSGLYRETFQRVAAGESGKSAKWPQGFLPKVAKLLVESPALADAPIMADYFKTQDDHLKWRDMIRHESASSNLKLRAWRERQMNRCLMEIGENQNAAITHIPAAFELARGCSVNCWFCSMKSGPLQGVFRYTRNNAKLWQNMLSALRDVVGPGAKWGCCYWGTEPLDNPDYEKFCHDFFETFGLFPQTTTAVPLRNIDRTHALLAESHAKGCRINRFSIHSAEQFHGVLASFSAQELANTELLLENPERMYGPLVMAGKLFNIQETMPEVVAREKEKAIAMAKEDYPDILAQYDTCDVNFSHLDEGDGNSRQFRINMPSTTSCMSGFLINMVEKTVRLVSPCAADEKWPKGYIVFDQGHFDSAETFRTLLLRMIEDNMPEKVLPADYIILTHRVNYNQTENGFVLSTVFMRVAYENKKIGAYLTHLGNLLKQGSVRSGGAALECLYLFGIHESLTFGIINDLFNKGLLEIEKIPERSSQTAMLS